MLFECKITSSLWLQRSFMSYSLLYCQVPSTYWFSMNIYWTSDGIFMVSYSSSCLLVTSTGIGTATLATLLSFKAVLYTLPLEVCNETALAMIVEESHLCHSTLHSLLWFFFYFQLCPPRFLPSDHTCQMWLLFSGIIIFRFYVM